MHSAAPNRPDNRNFPSDTGSPQRGRAWGCSGKPEFSPKRPPNQGASCWREGGGNVEGCCPSPSSERACPNLPSAWGGNWAPLGHLLQRLPPPGQADPPCTSWLRSRRRPGTRRRCRPRWAPGLARRRAAWHCRHQEPALHPRDTDGCSRDNEPGTQAQLCLGPRTGGRARHGPVPRAGALGAVPGGRARGEPAAYGAGDTGPD